MTLKFPKASRDERRCVLEALPVDGGGRRIEAVVPYYTLDPCDLETDEVLARAAGHGRVHLVVSNGPEFVVHVENDGRRVTYIEDDPIAVALGEALERASRDRRIAAHRLDVRLLDVRPLGFRALWLHGDTDEDDYLIPLWHSPNVAERRLLRARTSIAKLREQLDQEHDGEILPV